MNVETNIFRRLNSYLSKKFNLFSLTITISLTKETNIQIIRGGHQQLRIIKNKRQREKKNKTKTKTKKPFNLFSTSIAIFKGVSWQNVKSKPIFNAACCLYINLQNYEKAPSWIIVYKLSLSYSNTRRDPQLEIRGCLVDVQEGGRPVIEAASFCF